MHLVLDAATARGPHRLPAQRRYWGRVEEDQEFHTLKMKDERSQKLKRDGQTWQRIGWIDDERALQRPFFLRRMRRKLKNVNRVTSAGLKSVTVRLFRRPTLPIVPHKTLGKERIIKYKWELEGKRHLTDAMIYV